MIAAADFFTVEEWTTRDCSASSICSFSSCHRGEIGAISAAANGLWMSQVARNRTDSVDGLLAGKRYLIYDRLNTLKHAGVESLKLPPRRPNLNTHAERFVRSIKESCLERLILFGESSLQTAVQNFVAYYHSERNRQGRLRNHAHLGGAYGIQCRQHWAEP
jgi:hypothetical protein